VQAAASQVDGVLVVDNTPHDELTPEIQSALENLPSTTVPPGSAPRGILLIQNRMNLGLSKAYNLALALAVKGNYQFALLLDQDSSLLPGAVNELISRFQAIALSLPIGAISGRNIEANRVGGIAFRLSTTIPAIFRERAYAANRLIRAEGVEELRTFTNSGTLVPLALLPKVGVFDERLFLDAVDYEFSLRLRSKGYHIFEARQARLRHRQGRMYTLRLGGREVALRGHTPNRGYTIVKDTIRFARRWWARFPRDVTGIVVSTTIIIVGGILLLPERDARCRATIAGLHDSGNRGDA